MNSEFRDYVFSHMLETRGSKFRRFLRAGEAYKSFFPEQGEFVQDYYCLMRYLDDIVDGDAPVPGNEEPAQYMRERIDFVKRLHSPKDKADLILVDVLSRGNTFGGFYQESIDIMNSLLFDAERRGKLEIFPSEILEHHFYLLDIRGTISGSLKVVGEDPAYYPLLRPLGEATRAYYNLRDIVEDLAAGYVNVPVEFGVGKAVIEAAHQNAVRLMPRIQAIERRYAGLGWEKRLRHREGHKSILQRAHSGLVESMGDSLKDWYHEELGRTEGLLDSYRLDDLPFKGSTKKILRFVYEKPVEKFLEKQGS